MRNKQRSREFWEKMVARAKAGKKRAQVAKEFDVGVPALSYWVYKGRSERATPTASSISRALVPVRVVEPDPGSESSLSLEFGGMIVRLDERSDVKYVARLAGALRSC